MDITKIKSRETIHCSTLEESIEICKLMHQAGMKWCTKESYLKINNFNSYKENTVYNPTGGDYGDLDYFTKEGMYTIYKASEFLKEKIHELW